MSDPRERFWGKVVKGDGCWVWTGAHDDDGYARWGISRFVHKAAHRYAYEDVVGPIPEGLQLDHLCRNRGCVNPAHLEPVTLQENRRRGVQHGYPGETNLQAKVTADAVLAIRAAAAAGEPYSSLSARFGLSLPHVGKIVRRERWKHLP